MSLTDRYVSSVGSGTYAGSTNPATPMSFDTAIANAVAGDRINVKADGAYSRPFDIFTNSGSSTSPIIYRGYKTTIGDGYLGRTNGNGALITTNMPLLSYGSTDLCIPGSSTIFESLQISGAVNDLLAQPPSDCTFRGCAIANSSGGGILCALRTNIIDCDLATTGASAIPSISIPTNANSRVLASRIKGGSGPAIAIGLGFSVVDSCTLFRSSGVPSIDLTGSTGCAAYIAHNTIVNTLSGGDGIKILGGNTASIMLFDNMVTDNGGVGVDVTTAIARVILVSNRFRNNTSGASTGATDWIAATNWGAVTSGAETSDYTNAASDDYSLQSASPAIAAGLPPYASIGANQIHVAPTLTSLTISGSSASSSPPGSIAVH